MYTASYTLTIVNARRLLRTSYVRGQTEAETLHLPDSEPLNWHKVF